MPSLFHSISGVHQICTVDSSKRFIKVFLGGHSVWFSACLEAIIRIGYCGFLAIESEMEECPHNHIHKSELFLKQLLKEEQTV